MTVSLKRIKDTSCHVDSGRITPKSWCGVVRSPSFHFYMKKGDQQVCSLQVGKDVVEDTISE